MVYPLLVDKVKNDQNFRIPGSGSWDSFPVDSSDMFIVGRNFRHKNAL